MSAEAASKENTEMSRMFLPPLARNMKVLDRAFFKKTIPLHAAKVLDNSRIAAIRKECHEDILNVNSLHKNQVIRAGEHKAVLLNPTVKPEEPSTMSAALRAYLDQKVVELYPYTLELGYADWNYSQMIEAILPEDLHDDIPSGFTQTGHIAHVNLRERYLPYKHIIAQMILDKNPKCRTVVNKLDTVGVVSKFRTFPMEVLAGEDNTLVEVSENNCKFEFDFKNVYWNSRLETEHRRLANSFKKGEAVADVMAGVGPFALPAGKQNVIVWANDLNPESYASLVKNAERNKVSKFVTCFNLDGAEFIRTSVEKLYQLSQKDNSALYIEGKVPRHTPANKRPPPEKMPIPPVFSHFVMNLPATAIEFLDAFIGVYHSHPELAEKYAMPTVHVYCFNKPDEPETAPQAIVDRIRKAMRFEIPVSAVKLHDVRLVAPNKRMYCCTFTLPKEVALAEPLKEEGQRSEQDREDWKRWEAED